VDKKVYGMRYSINKHQQSSGTMKKLLQLGLPAFLIATLKPEWFLALIVFVFVTIAGIWLLIVTSIYSRGSIAESGPRLKHTLTTALVIIAGYWLFHQISRWLPEVSLITIIHFFGSPPAYIRLGAASAAFGIYLCVSAARCLGGMFRYQTALTPGHRLVTTGPYSLVRHPMYLGYVLTLSGAAAMIYLPILPVAFAAVLSWVIPKAKSEEDLLKELPEHAAYRASTPFLFPTPASFLRFLKE